MLCIYPPKLPQEGLVLQALYAPARVLTEQEADVAGKAADLLFLSDGKSSEAQAAYHAMDMNSPYFIRIRRWSSILWRQSCWSLGVRNCASPLRKPLWKNLSLTREEFEDEEEKSLLFQAYLPAFSCPGKKSGIHRCSSLVKAGSCRLLPYGPQRFYLYHVLIPQRSPGTWTGHRPSFSSP